MAAEDLGNSMVRSTGRPSGCFAGAPAASATWQCPPSQVECRLPLPKPQVPLAFHPPSTGTARHCAGLAGNPHAATARGSPKISLAAPGARYAADIEQPEFCTMHQAVLASASAMATI